MERDVWTVDGTLAIALRVSRVLGAAPLRLRAHGAALHARVSRPHALYGVVLIATLNIMVMTGLALELAHNMENIQRMIGGSTNTDFLMWLLNTLITHTLATVGVCTAHSRMARMVHHFSVIKETNIIMNSEKMKREKKRMAICILSLTMIFVLIIFDFGYSVKVTVLLKKDVLSACLYGAYYLCYYIGIVHEVQIVFITYEIHLAIEALNEKLERILSNIRETRPLDKEEQDSLRRIAIQFNSISNFVNHINKDDGGLMLLIFTCLNMYLLFTVYSLHTVILDLGMPANIIKAFVGADFELFNVIRQVTWCVIHITAMIVFVEPCHQIQKEVNQLCVLLTDLMQYSQPLGEPTATCVDAFYKQVFYDTPTFSPLGVCTFTRSLFTITISGLTTCLVFVVQYRSSDANKYTK